MKVSDSLFYRPSVYCLIMIRIIYISASTMPQSVNECALDNIEQINLFDLVVEEGQMKYKHVRM